MCVYPQGRDVILMSKAPAKKTPVNCKSKSTDDSYKFLKEVARKSYCGIAVVSQNGAVEFLNPAMEKFFGIKAGTFNTIKEWAKLAFPVRKERDEVLALWDEDVASDKPPERIFSIADSDGGKRWCRFQLSRMSDGRIVVHAEEVTAQHDSDLLQSQYQYAMDHLATSVLWVNAEGRFIYVNDTVCNILGYTRKKMLTMNVWDIDPLMTAKSWPKAWAHIKKEGVITLESIYRKKDGAKFPVEISANYCVFEGKEYSFAFAKDVSERKKMDQEMLDSEIQFRSIIESSPMGMHIYHLESDERLVFLGANPSADKILGVDHSWFVGKSIEEAFPSLVGTDVPRQYRDLARNGGYWFQGDLDYTDDKMTGTFDVHAFQTVPNTMVTMFTEVTERRKTASELRQLAAAVESAAESICITDNSGIIIYSNPAFEEMTGYSRAEVLGQHTRIFRSGRHDDKFYAKLWNTILKGHTWRGNFINKKKDGSIFEESAVISPVLNNEGDVVNFVAVKRDVTMERILEEQVRQSQKMAAIGQLAHRVAHNFTNVLVVILGNAQLAKSVLAPSSDASKFISEVIDAANRVSTLTAELIAFSHPAELCLQTMRLDKALLGIEDILRETIAPRIKLNIDLSDANFKVSIDPIQIEQALLHLSINADEAMKGDYPELSIFAGPSDLSPEFAMITITDNGPGISEEMKHQIFDPFTTTKATAMNPGLGLATVYGIINRHGGFINVDSTIGKGTSFKIYLPKYIPERAQND